MKILNLSLVLGFLGLFLYSTSMILYFNHKLYSALSRSDFRVIESVKKAKKYNHSLEGVLYTQIALLIIAIIPVFSNKKLLLVVLALILLQCAVAVLYLLHFTTDGDKLEKTNKHYNHYGTALTIVLIVEIVVLTIFGYPLVKCLVA